MATGPVKTTKNPIQHLPLPLQAMAAEIALLTEEAILQKVLGRTVRKTVSSVSGNMVTCTDTTIAVRLKGTPVAAGDTVYLANVSENPTRPAYFVVGAEEVSTASPTLQVGEAFTYVNHYSPVGALSTPNTATAIDMWSAGSIPAVTLPSGTFDVEITTTINFSRDVGTGGFVYDQRLTTGTGLGGTTFRNYSGYHYNARTVRTWTGIAGGASREMQIAWRGNETAGNSRVHDVLQVVRATRRA